MAPPNNDLLPPGPGDPPPTPSPSPIVPKSRITCDFCGCSLAPSGDVLKMSDDAKAYRDGADKIDTLNATITDLESQIATLKREKDALAAAVPPAKKGIFS